MFAKLSGVVDSLEAESAVIDVHGVGYLVQASRTTLSHLGAAGQPAHLFIETHVREDRITLYGFSRATERDWFRRLITVQGVGPKVALALLSVLLPEALATALAAGDAKALSRADGVGPKLAARIAAEFKGKDPFFSSALSPMSTGTPLEPVPSGMIGGAVADAISALVNLGYGRSEAFSAVTTIRARLKEGEDADVSTLIKAGLKELAA